jgi:hypothetical protein
MSQLNNKWNWSMDRRVNRQREGARKEDVRERKDDILRRYRRMKWNSHTE